jgi:hypothetical protein
VIFGTLSKCLSPPEELFFFKEVNWITPGMRTWEVLLKFSPWKGMNALIWVCWE